MGNSRMICATTIKGMVAQGSAKTSKKGAPLPPPLKGWVVVVARHTLAPRWWRKLVLMARKRFARRGAGWSHFFALRGQGVPDEVQYCCNPLFGGVGHILQARLANWSAPDRRNRRPSR